MYRYLTYAIDKHQSSPSFRNDIPDWLKQNCDDCLDVVVDLQTLKRYFNGEWDDVSLFNIASTEQLVDMSKVDGESTPFANY